MVTRARHKELTDFIQIIFHLGSLTYGKCSLHSLHSLHRCSCLCRRRHTTLKFMTDEAYQIINLLPFQLVFESRHAITSLGTLFAEVWIGMMQGVPFAQACHLQSGAVFQFDSAAAAFF